MKTSLQENIKQFERKQIIVSLLGLLIITGLSVISNRVFMQSAAEQTTNLITRMVQNGYFHEIELTLQSAKLDYFHTIRFNSKALNRSFTFPALAEYVHDRSIGDAFLYEKIELRPQIMSSSSNEDMIIFEYNRFGFVNYSLVIWLILNLVSIPQTRLIKNKIIEQFNKDIELMKKSAQTEISRKVRHNINTPLAALIAMTARLEKLGKNDQILFESIVKQIKSLVKDLDTTELGTDSNISKEKVSTSILHLIRDGFCEVKTAFAHDYDIEFEIQNSLMSGKTSLIPHEFRSIISNLVQNAVDATPVGGKITMTARDLSNQVEIKIKDTGNGMTQEVLKRSTEKNFTSGKVNGSGLGLYHAKTYIESWGGDLNIESTEGVGTAITIHLPITERASWFTPRIKIRSNQTVVILDDQISQHHVWDLKLAENGFHGNTKKFSSPKEFITFKKQCSGFSDGSDYVFFFDYDLGAGEVPGLELLKEISPSTQRHLVTGHFDDCEIQETCARESIFLIPKVDLSELPMVVR
ncbi:MAG: HAMP domain-containing histidine kinase [Bdellovibrionaceae bacterium]|nr:HAMP domain-containing histidine kinase [Pseudobdellovibrionaceae bacterium]